MPKLSSFYCCKFYWAGTKVGQDILGLLTSDGRKKMIRPRKITLVLIFKKTWNSFGLQSHLSLTPRGQVQYFTDHVVVSVFQCLALCTSAITLMLSQDRQNADLDRSVLGEREVFTIFFPLNILPIMNVILAVVCSLLKQKTKTFVLRFTYIHCIM